MKIFRLKKLMRFVEIKIIPKMKKLFTLLLMVLISGLYAQTTGSSIEGKLTDQNGDPHTGATIFHQSVYN